MITIKTNFEGANPRDAGQVERLGETAFRIRPYSEDGDGNYKFTLLVRVTNRSSEAVDAVFEIDWQDQTYMSCRDYVLLGRTDRWRQFPAEPEGSVARARVTVWPGRHELTLHPTYGLARLGAWRRRAERDGPLTVRQVGRTRQDRPILAFESGPSGEAGADPAGGLAIVARFHPYETAGSFTAEGALRQLLRSAGAGSAGGRRVSAVLIANPDGVANGLCKRTAAGGPDLTHQGATSDDPAAGALRAWLDEFRPRLLLDFHGWMYRYQDGFDFTDPGLARQLEQQLYTSGELDRAWKQKDLSQRPEPDSLWNYALSRYGTQSLIFSFGWYGRSIRHMRSIGAAVVSALDRCGR